MAISKLVNILKTVSSRLIRKEFAEELSQIYCKRVLWTHAYCVISAGGAPLEVLRDYIQGQGQERSHHKAIKRGNYSSAFCRSPN